MILLTDTFFQRIFVRDMGKCVTCGRTDNRGGGPNLRVYNLDMRPSEGNEREDDVAVFCDDCATRHTRLYQLIKERTTIVR